MGGDYVKQGPTIQVVRGIGLIGGGEDPMLLAMQADTPMAKQLDEEAKRLEQEGKKEQAEEKRDLADIERAKAAAAILRAEENRRIMEIRNIVITAVGAP